MPQSFQCDLKIKRDVHTMSHNDDKQRPGSVCFWLNAAMKSKRNKQWFAVRAAVAAIFSSVSGPA
jgi:hypothetical protein